MARPSYSILSVALNFMGDLKHCWFYHVVFRWMISQFQRLTKWKELHSIHLSSARWLAHLGVYKAAAIFIWRDGLQYIAVWWPVRGLNMSCGSSVWCGGSSATWMGFHRVLWLLKAKVKTLKWSNTTEMTEWVAKGLHVLSCDKLFERLLFLLLFVYLKVNAY